MNDSLRIALGLPPKGELTMSNTKPYERYARWINANTGRIVKKIDIDELLKLIESDREATRAETRAEVLKDHGIDWKMFPCSIKEVTLEVYEQGQWLGTLDRISRPLPKTRPMRPNEIQEALVKFVKTCDQETFNNLVVVSGIPTEVEES